jgi:Secretion system C-terminal sorting domain/FG-GAP repeat
MKKISLLFFVFFRLINISYSQTSGVMPDWYFGMLGNNLGDAGIIVADLDGNGINDIISSGMYNTSSSSPNSFITVTEYSIKEKTFRTKWISRLYFHKITKLQIYDFNNDGIQEIYAGFDDGSIKVYDSKTFAEMNTFYTSKRIPSFFDPPNQIDDLEFGDADNDGYIDLVVTNGDTTYYFDSSFKLKSKCPVGAKYFKIGDIDNDHLNEIIYSNGKITQYVKGKNTLKYQFYTNNTQTPIALSDINQDGTKDVIYSSQDTLNIYDFKNSKNIWTKKWVSKYNQPISKIYLFDYDHDNIEDVFIGNSDYDGVYCLNGKNGVVDFSISDVNYDGVTNIAVADLDGDKDLDILWATGANNSEPDYYFVYDLNSKTRLWQSTHYEGEFTAFDIGDLKNDHQNELVIGNYGYKNTYYDYPLLIVLNAKDHSILWQNEAPDFLRVDNLTSVSIGDINNDGKNELLVGVDQGYAYTYVYELDSTYAIKRNIQISGMNIVRDMKIADVDQDNENELVVTLGTNIIGSTDPEEWNNHIYIFDGKTGSLEWQSKQLGGISSNIGSLCIGNIDNDDALEIVALKYKSLRDTSCLYIIDGKTHDLIEKKGANYSAVDIADIDNDGKQEIIIGMDNGEISILDGSSLTEKKHIKTNRKTISALKAYDLNNSNSKQLIFADNYTLNIYDIKDSVIKWGSDTLGSFVGEYNSLKIGDFDSDGYPDILVNVNHALFQYKIDYNAIHTNLYPKLIQENNRLFQNYPNPFSSKTTIDFELEKNSNAQIKIYDLIGKEIFSRKYFNLPEGTNSIEIRADKLSASIYNYVLIIDNEKKYSKKMVVIK